MISPLSVGIFELDSVSWPWLRWRRRQRTLPSLLAKCVGIRSVTFINFIAEFVGFLTYYGHVLCVLDICASRQFIGQIKVVLESPVKVLDEFYSCD